MDQNWATPSSRIIARREKVLGLPLPYAAILITLSLLLALSLHYVAAGAYLFGVGWGLGWLVTYYDPFAWELIARNVALPKLLRA